MVPGFPHGYCAFVTHVPTKCSENGTPLWNRALQRYRDEIGRQQDYQNIVEAGSLEDLLNHARTIKPLAPQEQTALNSFYRLGPILKFLDDFSAIIAVSFGADAKLTALVWGSIRVILTLASSAEDKLQEVLDMLEELSLTLPKFKNYEQTLPIDIAFESALLDVYTEVICFYARLIRFFRRNPIALMRSNAWVLLQGDFGITLRRIKRLASHVENEADLARMRLDRDKYGDVLEHMKNMKESRSEDKTCKCFNIPYQFSPNFWGREQALHAVTQALDPEEKVTPLRSFALYGMGGVGKTQIALQYAHRNREKYDAILWVMANTTISIGQSFTDIARTLGLVKSDEEGKDAIGAILKVKNWCIEARE